MSTYRHEGNRSDKRNTTGSLTPEERKKRREAKLKAKLAALGLGIPDPEDVEKEFAVWKTSYPRVDPQQDALIRLAVTEAVEMENCNRVEQEIMLVPVKRAEQFWNHDCRLAAEKLAKSLGRKPELVSFQLEQTLQGCALKIERWESLHAKLGKGKPWNKADRKNALDLLGTDRFFRSHRNPLDPKPGQTDSEAHRVVVTREIDRLRRETLPRLVEDDRRRRDFVIKGYDMPLREMILIQEHGGRCQRRFVALIQRLHASYGHGKKHTPASSRPKPEPEDLSPISFGVEDYPVTPSLFDEFEAGEETTALAIDIERWIAKITDSTTRPALD